MHCHNSHTNTEFNTFEYPTKKSGPFIFILFGHLSSISESSFLHFLFPYSLQCLSKFKHLFFQMCNEITLQIYNSSTVSHCINFIQAMEIFNTNNLLPILKIHQYKLNLKDRNNGFTNRNSNVLSDDMYCILIHTKIFSIKALYLKFQFIPPLQKKKLNESKTLKFLFLLITKNLMFPLINLSQ